MGYTRESNSNNINNINNNDKSYCTQKAKSNNILALHAKERDLKVKRKSHMCPNWNLYSALDWTYTIHDCLTHSGAACFLFDMNANENFFQMGLVDDMELKSDIDKCQGFTMTIYW